MRVQRMHGNTRDLWESGGAIMFKGRLTTDAFLGKFSRRRRSIQIFLRHMALADGFSINSVIIIGLETNLMTYPYNDRPTLIIIDLPKQR